MNLNLKKFKQINLYFSFFIFLFFLILTVARILLSTHAGEGSLKVMAAPLNEDVNRIADPIKDMQEMVSPKNEKEKKNPQGEEQWNRNFLQYAEKITIQKNSMHRFDFKTKMAINSEVIFEFYDSKKEFVLSYSMYYENDSEKQLYIDFPGTGEYYLFASVPFDINGKPSIIGMNEIEKYSDGKIFFQSFQNTWKIWNVLFPSILFLLFWFILLKNYRRGSSKETVNIQKYFTQFLRKIGLWTKQIAKNPLELFKNFTLLFPFLMIGFFLLIQFGCLEKNHYKGSISVAPIALYDQEETYFNYYSKKITVKNPEEIYKLRLKVPGWELDSPSGNVNLALLNSEKKIIKSYDVSFYHQEKCCNDEGDDYTVSNYSEGFLFHFPSSGDYFAQVFIASSTMQNSNVSQYNVFKDNTDGDLFFSVSTAMNFGERPFNGILFFVSAFLLLTGILSIHRKKYLQEWNYSLILISFAAIFVFIYCIVDNQLSWKPFYLYGLTVSIVALLIGILNFKGASKVILSILLFFIWIVPATVLFGVLMAFLFCVQPVAGIACFFNGISEGAHPAFLYWSFGLISGFILWMLLFMKIRKKTSPKKLYLKIVREPYRWMDKWQ